MQASAPLEGKESLDSLTTLCHSFVRRGPERGRSALQLAVLKQNWEACIVLALFGARRWKESPEVEEEYYGDRAQSEVDEEDNAKQLPKCDDYTKHEVSAEASELYHGELRRRSFRIKERIARLRSIEEAAMPDGLPAFLQSPRWTQALHVHFPHRFRAAARVLLLGSRARLPELSGAPAGLHSLGRDVLLRVLGMSALDACWALPDTAAHRWRGPLRAVVGRCPW